MSNKLFGELLGISPQNVVLSKTFTSEFLFAEVWFTDQNSKQVQIKDKIYINFVNN